MLAKCFSIDQSIYSLIHQGRLFMTEGDKPEARTIKLEPVTFKQVGSTLHIDTSNVGRAVAGSVIVTGGRHIAGTGNLVVGTSGTVVGRDVKITTENEKRVLSEDQAFERIGATVKVILDQFQLNITQARNESRQFFKLTMIFTAVAFLTIIAGVGLCLAHLIAAGVVSIIASIIPGATAALFFKKDKELRGTIEGYHQQILESQNLHTMIDVAETVMDEKERDSLKRAIIYKALGIKPAK
jgi:hypothetical protein